MASIMEYLDWRGDIPFSFDPFNEADNLLLCQIAYVHYENIVPGMDTDVRIGAASSEDGSDRSFQRCAGRRLCEQFLQGKGRADECSHLFSAGRNCIRLFPRNGQLPLRMERRLKSEFPERYTWAAACSSLSFFLSEKYRLSASGRRSFQRRQLRRVRFCLL